MQLLNDKPQTSLATEASYQFYFNGLLAGNHLQCQQAVDDWLAIEPALPGLYEQLFRRALYEIGALWENGTASVATEHLATVITERMLTHVYPRLFSATHTGKSAVVCCALNEYHQVGAKMVADVFEMQGWRCWFLGAHTSIAHLLALIADKRPDVVTLSLTLYFNQEALLNMTTVIREAFPDLPILVGGQAFQQGGAESFERINDVHYLASLAELKVWLQARGVYAV